MKVVEEYLSSLVRLLIPVVQDRITALMAKAIVASSFTTRSFSEDGRSEIYQAKILEPWVDHIPSLDSLWGPSLASAQIMTVVVEYPR